MFASDFGRVGWWFTQGLAAVLNGWVIWNGDLQFKALYISCFLIFPLDQWGFTKRA